MGGIHSMQEVIVENQDQIVKSKGLSCLLNGSEIRKLVFQLLVTSMRVLYGLGWFLAGVTKITGKAGELSWFTRPTVFLTGYLIKALDKPNVPVFYKYFIKYAALSHVAFFNYTIPVVQIIVGICIVFGFAIIPLVIIALFMHINFILSGNMNLISLLLYTSAFGIFFCKNHIYALSLDRYFGLEKIFALNKQKNNNSA
jgi:thiosulfate dehydrogenase [quinone] large subunit